MWPGAILGDIQEDEVTSRMQCEMKGGTSSHVRIDRVRNGGMGPQPGILGAQEESGKLALCLTIGCFSRLDHGPWTPSLSMLDFWLTLTLGDIWIGAGGWAWTPPSHCSDHTPSRGTHSEHVHTGCWRKTATSPIIGEELGNQRLPDVLCQCNVCFMANEKIYKIYIQRTPAHLKKTGSFFFFLPFFKF